MHSNPNTNVLLIFILKFSCLAISIDGYGQHHLSYNEITALNASCAPDDTCFGLEETSVFTRKCDCDRFCAKYGSCCIDSPYTLQARKRKVYPGQIEPVESCLNISDYRHSIFAVNKCKPNWRGSLEVKSSCETEDTANFIDPISIVPVTNPLAAITYKNYFCAHCNDVWHHNLVFWNIAIKSKEKFEKNSLLEQLVYDTKYGQWGILKDGPFNKTFEAVALSFRPPECLDDKMHRCFTDLVTTCHPDWKDDAVKYKCWAYMGRIYADVKNAENSSTKKMFKNIHCAICNFAQYESRTLCEGDFSIFQHPGLSFASLLDINPSDGNKVGEVSRCKGGETYDPFFKKCRAMVCVKPGYQIKDGKCVPS